jgi:histidyl-tRNA synthetase
MIVLNEALKLFNFKNISLKISSRDFLLKFLESFQIKDIKSFMTILDKGDKIGFDGVLEELISKGFDKNICKNILEILNDDQKFEEYCKDKPSIKEIIYKVNEIVDLVKPFLDNINVYFCKTLVRGFDYYTSTVFEFYSDDLKATIAGGGRYDELTSIFNDDKTPACGGSIGIERIFGLMENENSKSDKKSVLIALFDENMKKDCLELLLILTKANINAEIYLSPDKLKDQIKYALDKNCKYILIYGPDEKEKGAVTIKNLETKEQKEIKKENISEEIQ